eukprot:COSAG05_NODE_15816_length_360_cov_1.030651_1_plen_59_part_01
MMMMTRRAVLPRCTRREGGFRGIGFVHSPLFAKGTHGGLASTATVKYQPLVRACPGIAI